MATKKKTTKKKEPFKTKKAAKAFLSKCSRLQTAEDKKRILYENKEWYTIRADLGNQWANWFIEAGARERGKTFTVQDFVLGKWFNKNDPLFEEPFYWMRLNDKALETMMMNNGAKMFEPILVRKYGLENIKVRGDSVFLNKKLLCRVYGLSTAYNAKGSALFDAEKFKGVNIIIDEVALERGQRRTFDVVYNLKLQIENICRHERKNVRVFMMLNNTEDCPELMAMFGFIPIEFGVYKLKRKHCLMHYIANNKAYENRRKNALVNDIGSKDGNYSNKIARDMTLLYKKRLNRPTGIIKFSKDQDQWYTIWDSNVICKYKGEKKKTSIAMRRYIDEFFDTKLRDSVIERNDVRGWRFRDILTQQLFYKDIEIIKK